MKRKQAQKAGINPVERRAVLKMTLRYIKPYRALVIASFVVTVLSVVLTLYVPVLIGQAIDRIVAPGLVDFTGITERLIKIAVAVLLVALGNYTAAAICQRVTYRIVADIRGEAIRRIEVLPLSYLDRNASGGIVSRVVADAEQFADGLLLGFTTLFSGILTIIGTLVFMLTLRADITLVVVVLTPLSLLSAKFITGRTYTLFRVQSEIRGEQTALIDEMIGNQKVVKAFSHEAASIAKFDEVNDRLEHTTRRAVFFSSVTNPCTRFVNSVVYAGVALTGALACVSGTGLFGAGAFTVGGLSAFLAYANQYTKPFNEISGVFAEMQNALACAARVFDLIKTPRETQDAQNAVTVTDAKGEIRLDHVSFSYIPEKPLLRDISLAVKPGMHVAIVGPTGCGKTTLINLLMRFYDVNAGKITLDGTDIRMLTRRSLRAQFGMVLQETWLRSGTVRDNIAMGKPDATADEVRAAATAAGAHGFITRLPAGYDTLIGEDGGTLSAGQKQLLCIARIMLCLPPMLILDEATSSIDTRTEIKIQQAFAEMTHGRTAFIVAHRLQTIRHADLILVMRSGNIIETGTHDALLAAGGFYAELYRSQFDTAG